MEKGLFEVLTEICNEKGISQEVLIDALEAALVAAYKKNLQRKKLLTLYMTNLKKFHLRTQEQSTVIIKSVIW